MRRVQVGKVRPGWEEINRAWGLTYNDTLLPDGRVVSYWREGPYFELTPAEVDLLEQATVALREMCVAAGDHIVATCPRRHRATRSAAYLNSVCVPDTCLMSKFGVPEYVHEQVIRTWLDGDVETWTHDDKDLDGRHQAQTPDFSPHIYGRFDLWFDGREVKLLEFNAQTPTSLVEAAAVQWNWVDGQTDHPDRQFNSIHERLTGWPATDGDPGALGAWRRNIDKLRAARPWLPERPKVFFAYETSETSGEDRMNTAYLEETCRQAGYPTELIAMSQIAWDVTDDRVVFQRHPSDPAFPDEPIDIIFMLYPWEWFWNEEGGKPFFRNMARSDKRGTVWIEPPYTAALWGNKGLLPVLWQLFGHDPERSQLLLPAYFEDERPADMTSYVRKPMWGREGGNVTLVRDGAVVASNGGVYGREGYVVQELRELPAFEGVEGVMRPVIGSWLIDGEPAGVGIREGDVITDNRTSFIPHTINAHPM